MPADNAHSAQSGGFHRLFLSNQRRLFGYILTLLPRMEEAEEVLQDASVIILSKAADFRPGTDFLCWACQIAKFEVFNYRRRHQGERLRMTDAALDAVADRRLAEREHLETRHRALWECLERLPPRDRSLIEARYAEKTTSRALAVKLGMIENTVYKALGRIRRALRVCIERKVAQEDQV
jgi:RNA polymerase sigma-70 factor, ECF subfamily